MTQLSESWKKNAAKTSAPATSVEQPKGFLQRFKENPLAATGSALKGFGAALISPIVKTVARLPAAIQSGFTNKDVTYDLGIFGKVSNTRVTKENIASGKIKQQIKEDIGLAGEFGLTALTAGIGGAGAVGTAKAGFAAAKAGATAEAKQVARAALAKQLASDIAIGGGFGGFVGLQEKDSTFESVAKATAVGAAVGVIAPRALGKGLEVTARGTKAVGKFAGKSLRGTAEKLEAFAGKKKPRVGEIDPARYAYEFATQTEYRTRTQRLAEATARTARAIADFPQAFRKNIVNGFTKFDDYMQSLKERGADTGNLKEFLQNQRSLIKGREESGRDAWHDFRTENDDVWEFVAERSKILNDLDNVSNGVPVYGVIAGERRQLDIQDLQAAYDAHVKAIPVEKLDKVSKAIEDVNGFWDQELQFLVEKKRVSPETYARLKEKHPNYMFQAVKDFVIPDNGELPIGLPTKSQNAYKKAIYARTGTERDLTSLDNAYLLYQAQATRNGFNNETTGTVVDVLAEASEKLSEELLLPQRTIADVTRRKNALKFFSDSKKTLREAKIAARNLKVGSKKEVARIEKLERQIVDESERLMKLAKEAFDETGDEDARIIFESLLAQKGELAYQEERTFGGFLEGQYQKFRKAVTRDKKLLDIEDVEQFKSTRNKKKKDTIIEANTEFTDDEAFSMFKERYLAHEKAKAATKGKPSIRKAGKLARKQEALKENLDESLDQLQIEQMTSEDIATSISRVEENIKITKQQRKSVWDDLRNIKTKQMRAVDYEKAGFTKVSRWIDDVREDYLIPKDVGDAIKNVGSPTAKALLGWLNSSAIGKVLTLPATVIRNVATVFNPFFIAKNVVRDAQTGAAIADISVKEYGRTLIETIFKRSALSEERKLAMLNGSFAGGYYRSSVPIEQIVVETASRKGVISRISHPLRAIQDLGKASEELTRLSIFRTALKKGLSPREAGVLARNSTVDFGRFGDWGQVINSVIPFFNARVQGLSNLVKLASERPDVAGRKLFWSAAAPATMLYAYNARYESYQNIPEYEKQQYWIIMAGESDGVGLDKKPIKVPFYIKIPKGEPQQALAAVTERILSTGEKESPKSTREFLAQIVGNTLPADAPSDFLPPAIQKWVEIKTNYDFFRDKKIVPDWIKIKGKWYNSNEIDQKYQATYSTSEVAKFLGEAMGWSPIKIDHILQTGILSDIVNLVPNSDREDMISQTDLERYANMPGLRHFVGAKSYGQKLDLDDKELEAKIEENREKLFKALGR